MLLGEAFVELGFISTRIIEALLAQQRFVRKHRSQDVIDLNDIVHNRCR